MRLEAVLGGVQNEQSAEPQQARFQHAQYLQAGQGLWLERNALGFDEVARHHEHDVLP
jgi:hypothetical protein